MNRDSVFDSVSAVNLSNNENKKAVIFSSAEYERGASEDEPKENVEMWLPLTKTVENYDYPEAVDKTVWDTLNLGEKLTESKKFKLLALLKTYAKKFYHQKYSTWFLPTFIETRDAAPIGKQLRRFSFGQQNEIAKQVTKLLEIGVISSCESKRAANVQLVRKKDGSIRMIVDSRALNRVTIKTGIQWEVSIHFGFCFRQSDFS